jgi:hypothetical protein
VAHPLPKLTYGLTEIAFPYPPIEKEGEDMESKDHESVSLSGKRQISVDHIEATRTLEFSFLDEAKKLELENFFKTHGYLGLPFTYQDDSNDPTTAVVYEIKSLKWKAKKIAPKGNGTYVWSVPFVFRRVVGAAETEILGMYALIANNQGVAANITAMSVDKTIATSSQIWFELRRKTATTELIANGRLSLVYRESTALWELGPPEMEGDDVGVTFSVTSNGQIQYTSTNMTGGSYTGTITFRKDTLGV